MLQGDQFSGQNILSTERREANRAAVIAFLKEAESLLLG